ncbi:MAG: hypothetical protein IT306_23210 [Chloroflexi bacterium]|nr:hypothetical protein [Chloroflexota bacterium]
MTWKDWQAFGSFLGQDSTLLGIGIFLTLIVVVGWLMASRAEATPNADQLAELHHFVREHFALHVARGLAANGETNGAISKDRAWRKVFQQHLGLHNELYAIRRDLAMKVYDEDIDAAVSRQLAALREARPQPSSVAVS